MTQKRKGAGKQGNKGLLSTPATPKQIEKDLEEIKLRKAEVDAARQVRGKMLPEYVPPAKRYIPAPAWRRGYSVDGNDY